MTTIKVESYWDWLPPEIQEYIVLLAQCQHIIDRVDEVWGLGRVKIVQYKCKFQTCHKTHHLELFLTYNDDCHREKQRRFKNIDLLDLEVLLTYVVEEKYYLRDTNQLDMYIHYRIDYGHHQNRKLLGLVTT